MARTGLDRQALAALGTARVDHGATTTGLHADQKAVGTSAANFGRLVSAFHFESLLNLWLVPRQQSGKPRIIANFHAHGKAFDQILHLGQKEWAE